MSTSFTAMSPPGFTTRQNSAIVWVSSSSLRYWMTFASGEAAAGGSMKALLASALTLLAGCTLPPPGTFSAEPIGHSTYGTIDGNLWTDTLTGNTTGTSVQPINSSLPIAPEEKNTRWNLDCSTSLD